MSAEVAVVQRQLDALNAHDLDAFLSCYANDAVIRNGDGHELMNGHEAMRGFYGPPFGDSALRAEVANRIHSGRWVVDEEHTVWTGGRADGLVAYEIRHGLIRTMIMLGETG